MDEELLDDFGLDEEDDEGATDTVPNKDRSAEPIFTTLLRRSINQLWGDDPVMVDFVEHVATPLSILLGHKTAKGGDFVIEKMAEGVDVSRYSDDQSMRAHLINGLFPVLHIAHTLHNWGVPTMRRYDDVVRRTFIAGYILHDWVKLPEVDDQLEAMGLSHDTVNAAQHLAEVEVIFRAWAVQLGLDQFLEPVGGLEQLLHDLIFVACNTQKKWGTLRNLSALPGLYLHGTERSLAERLSRLADYLAYVGRDPRQTVNDRYIHQEISSLSDQNAHLIYHHVAELRGVVTNLINNAALNACQNESTIPILYAPSGVVYLARTGATYDLNLEQIGQDVIDGIRRTAQRVLNNNLTGFNRDGKGLKYAEYYELFFEPIQMFDVGARATFKIIHDGKAPSSGKRFAKMRDSGWMNDDVDLDLPDTPQVDQLAEWCYFVEKLTRDLPGDLDAARILLPAMGLEHLTEQFDAVPRDVRAGGVGYHWYFAAGHFIKQNPKLDPVQVREVIEGFAYQMGLAVKAVNDAHQTAAIDADAKEDGFADLRAYIKQMLTFSVIPVEIETLADENQTNTEHFVKELDRYTNAKKRGRGTTSLCSLCSSPFEVTKQKEAAVLFSPQVYSNKLSLHGSNGLRDICSICGLETMLRQLLMNRSNASGGRFEGRRIRYLYFYPAYFFTPETMTVFRFIHDRLRRLSFTELRKQLVSEDNDSVAVQLGPDVWQQLEDLLLIPEEDYDPAEDRYLRMQFPSTEPITFYFLGVPPPGRDSKEAEAWVHPAFLSLLLPLCVDVKVVASESPMPLLNEANEMPETVLLDGAHAAIGYLAQKERLNLDQVLPTLKRLATGYLIHMDGNSTAGSGGYDYRWQDIPTLARHLSESSLYAFHYLKKWQRRVGLDGIPGSKAKLYLAYEANISNGGEDEMSHARILTELYRQFYRAGKMNSNSVLRPISVAASAILTADKRLFGDKESLTEVVLGELSSFMERVQQDRADGRLAPGSDYASRADAMQRFAEYFVGTLYFDLFRGDVSALRGKQLNLLKNACEVVYRGLDADYWAERKQAEESTQAV
ncbi:MAG: type I-D CRISPR-associated protein Cas10d/Csc3 [Caldilineaceae bacterium]|nr:type I-D CRISPR-associated protein Cas10d/Csc3 [Caldilineaceae bacterium]